VSVKPRIAITTDDTQARWGAWDMPAALLPRPYVDAVAAAGGLPVLLPPLGPDDAAGALAGLDGLIVSGGGDVDPARYGAPHHPATSPATSRRDAWELALLDAAAAAGLPVLAVCRGIQVLNAARGGTLCQHLPDRVGHEGHRPAPGTFGPREVRPRPGSLVHEILGGAVRVRCHHHQALDRVGDGLVPAAFDGDGTVEAVEAGRDGPLVLGVQWHPEQDDDLRLFRAVVAAAAGRAADREEAQL
jgi:putative glutamine amidotransferase